ncbi:hypothetical protein H072_11118 [Dactylellina haptotyla CBS 200.50]|uniref:ZZ-type domain-containing protein n=1 Tax=Dactylellina haptotyla (strain CBS 200.50) TaxID=1284197 RepID=S8A2W2_DACHA|nr:hypothetical protein H072_11118 [Dactylellina haptotyla CBS 200.50]
MAFHHNFNPVHYERDNPIGHCAFYDQNSEYICDVCKSHNFSGGVYHCSTCLNGDFDMCEGCKFQGRTCFCGQASSMAHLKIIPGKERRYFNSPAAATDELDSEDLAAMTLSELIPGDTRPKPHLDNPELFPYYEKYIAYTDTHRNPSYDTFLCENEADYAAWEKEPYKTQRDSHESKASHYSELTNEILHFVKYSARSGTKGWEYQTSDGEVCDLLDLAMGTIVKMEEAYVDVSNMTDEMNKQWASKEIVGARNVGNMQHMTACEEWYVKAVTEEAASYHKQKYERTSDILKQVELIIKKAQTLEKFAFDSLVAKLNAEVEAIRTGQAFTSTSDQRMRALEALEKHAEIKQKLENSLFNFRRAHISIYRIHSIKERPENEVSARTECDTLLAGSTEAKEDKLRGIMNEYDLKVSKSLLPAVSSVSAAAPLSSSSIGSAYNPQVTALSQGLNTVPSSNSGYTAGQQSAQVISNPSSSSTGVTNPPRFQMPLSYYSNMLAQQHVTNMNIINNIGGGDTTYSFVNPTTGLKYW